MSQQALGLNRMVRWIRRILGPLLLLTICPPLVMLVWYTNVFLNGSVESLYALFVQEGVFTTIGKVWGAPMFGNPYRLEDVSHLRFGIIIFDESIAREKSFWPNHSKRKCSSVQSQRGLRFSLHNGALLSGIGTT